MEVGIAVGVGVVAVVVAVAVVVVVVVVAIVVVVGIAVSVGVAGAVSRILLQRRSVMRRIIEDVNREGLEKLLGERVTLFCLNYIYTGTLTGVNESCVLLNPASIVYETGPLTTTEWQDAQKFPGPWYVQIGAIESFGVLK